MSKSQHADKYGNCGQGRVGVVGLVFPARYLSVEVLDGCGSGMCNLEVISQKGYICWTSTIVQHEQIPNVVGQSIWSFSVGNGGHQFHKGR